MTLNGWIQIALYSAIIVALTKPVGGFMTGVFAGERNFLSPVLRPVERGIYAVAGVDETHEQSWVGYAVAMLMFKVMCFLAVYALQRFQDVLPLNPDGQSAVAPALAYNTAISFLTNTNWQSYGGETTMSYLTQMVALTVQNFASAAAGIAMAIAFIRGFSRRSAKSIGNYWVDLIRCTLYILLPMAVVITLVYVWQGMPQTLGGHIDATTLEGAKQTIAIGPVASQEAIKILGTNGGGFFNVNSAHPFENPTALTNFIQVISIFVLGAGLTNVFGRMVGSPRQGWAVFAAMGLMFLAGVAVIYWSESHGNPILTALGVDPSMGNMEGKEVRFGIPGSALFITATTDASCGAVNAMIESFLPLAMLGFTAIAVVLPGPLAALSASGPHGFSEALYAYVSATGNNGSAFAGLSANTGYWNTTLALAMMIGRFMFVIPALAVAGSMAAKKTVPPSAGTFPTDGGLFVGLAIGVILIVGGLTFFPALALGPVVEHYAMNAGTLF